MKILIDTRNERDYSSTFVCCVISIEHGFRQRSSKLVEVMATSDILPGACPHPANRYELNVCRVLHWRESNARPKDQNLPYLIAVGRAFLLFNVLKGMSKIVWNQSEIKRSVHVTKLPVFWVEIAENFTLLKIEQRWNGVRFVDEWIITICGVVTKPVSGTSDDVEKVKEIALSRLRDHVSIVSSLLDLVEVRLDKDDIQFVKNCMIAQHKRMERVIEVATTKELLDAAVSNRDKTVSIVKYLDEISWA